MQGGRQILQPKMDRGHTLVKKFFMTCPLVQMCNILKSYATKLIIVSFGMHKLDQQTINIYLFLYSRICEVPCYMEEEHLQCHISIG